MNFLCVTSLFVLFSYGYGNSDQDENQSSGRYQIEGKVTVPFVNNKDWIPATRILIDGGEYLGFLK